MSKIVYSGKKGSKTTCFGSSKRTIKGRKPPNRHSFEEEDAETSRLAKKLKQSIYEEEIEVDRTFGYTFINFTAVFTALSQILVCKTCGGDIKFTQTNIRGLGFKIHVVCQNCPSSVIDSSPMINNSHAYDINRRLIFAMRLLGIGHYGIIKFCAFMSLGRPVYQSTYDAAMELLSTATDVVRKNSTKRAVETEKNISVSEGQTEGLTVSGDGSWRKRGFSSLYGFASLIGWHTGKVLDVIVKSKYCKSCEYWEKNSESAEYEEWFSSHKEACQANHTGSAGKMEVDAVCEMFKRSESLYDTRYTSYVGDGDSKTYKGILDCQPYGDVVISKKECVGHVQKRMGTRLRKKVNLSWTGYS